MDKFIIPENERKPEKPERFPDVRSQNKKSAFAKSLAETTADNS